MRRLLSITVMILTMAIPYAYAQRLDEMPQYKRENVQYGELRVWGFDPSVLKVWESGLSKNQPLIKFWINSSAGTATALGSLYTGVGNVALLGREALPMESQSFQRVFGYEPFKIIVATGSYDTGGTPGIVVSVNKQNPLSKLTIKQLDGIFGSRRTGGWQGTNWSTAAARSAEENIRTWGQLGLTGEWADKPINVYGFDLTLNGFSFSFQQKVFQGGDRWNPNLIEFPLSEPGRAGAIHGVGNQQMIEAVAADPYGIAYGAMKYSSVNPQVKTIALAAMDGGAYVEPTKENFQNLTYPLMIPICVYVNRPPGKPIEPQVKEFLRYILSREGQQDVAKDGLYLPLTPEVLRTQLKKLE